MTDLINEQYKLIEEYTIYHHPSNSREEEPKNWETTQYESVAETPQQTVVRSTVVELRPNQCYPKFDIRKLNS